VLVAAVAAVEGREGADVDACVVGDSALAEEESEAQGALDVDLLTARSGVCELPSRIEQTWFEEEEEERDARRRVR